MKMLGKLGSFRLCQSICSTLHRATPFSYMQAQEGMPALRPGGRACPQRSQSGDCQVESTRSEVIRKRQKTGYICEDRENIFEEGEMQEEEPTFCECGNMFIRDSEQSDSLSCHLDIETLGLSLPPCHGDSACCKTNFRYQC